MAFLVFSQGIDPVVSLDRLRAHASAHFGSAVEADETPAGDVHYRAHDAHGRFSLRGRPVTPPDIDSSRAAELLRGGGGLADLAARCSTVFVVDASDGTPEWLIFEFCALVASVSLGPILSEDRKLILGVKSAREHADQLRRLEGE